MITVWDVSKILRKVIKTLVRLILYLSNVHGHRAGHPVPDAFSTYVGVCFGTGDL